jgi:hypothetical protein
MPFDLFNLEKSLPSYLYGYIHIIKKCRKYIKSCVEMKKGILKDPKDIKNRIAYLTVDERPVHEAGRSQRREGLHVESPGAMRSEEIIEKSHYTTKSDYYHEWGFGSISGEYLVGGLFLVSNMSNSTAVWNSRVHDTFGDVIAKHGGLERCRSVLGEPKVLDAGELVWITDRTPHESLPLRDLSRNRQFFRLVVGEISYWFADHNTPNPTGFQVPSSVPIIEGNKFTLAKEIPVGWEFGSKKELWLAKERTRLREKLYKHSIGFTTDILSRHFSVHILDDLIGKYFEIKDSLRMYLEDLGHAPGTIGFILYKLEERIIYQHQT